MKIIKTLIFNVFIFLTIQSSHAIAGNCSITNGIKVGDCDKALQALSVKSIVSESGIISGATIYSGGVLNFRGISNGDITVRQGGKLYLHGKVNGKVINRGGEVEIYGHVEKLDNQYGKAYVEGIVDQSSGEVKYKNGAIINGKEIK